MPIQKRILGNFLDSLHPFLTRAFLPWIVQHPRYLRAAVPLARNYTHAFKVRNMHMEKGLRVPPVLIMSITSTCNLRCIGCYAASTGTINPSSAIPNTTETPHLDLKKWNSVISEAKSLGVFGFIIAGGEPFLYPGLLKLTQKHKDRFFIIVTNGTAITKDDFKILRKASNVGVIISLEGGKEATDRRRGSGVYKKVMRSLHYLWKAGVITGISSTITTENYEYWMNPSSLDSLLRRGLLISIFIEYIPLENPNTSSRQSISPCSEDGFSLNQDQRAAFREFVLSYRDSHPIVMIHSPNDEEYYGGCVSAGQGFAHITPAGDLTACPVSNLATHNLSHSSLRDALSSKLFVKIRQNGHLLKTHDIPCALLSHEDEVSALARTVGAYRTDTREAV